MSSELYSSFRGATIEEVIRVSVNEGDGTHDDPIRRVTYWYQKDGTLIAHNDEADRQFVPTVKDEHHQ